MSVVTEWEILIGARNKKEQGQFSKLLKRYNIIHIDKQTSEQASILIKIYQLNQDMKIPDALIAATAIRHKLRLYTRNVKDFKFIPAIDFYRE